MRLGKYGNLERFLGTEHFLVDAEHVVVRKYEAGDPTAAISMQREGRILASLDSEFIPRLIEVGCDERLDCFYYSMQAPGQLRPITWKIRSEAVVLLRDLAEALSWLQEQGVAYRNLRPDAVALAPTGRPLLFDFTRAARFDATRLVGGLRKPTTYDAPEAKDAQYDGVRGDIYSLGVLGKELTAGSGAESLKIAELLERMTAAEPRHRPSSMMEVQEALRR